MGVASAITAYVIWGFFPLYFALLPGVSPYKSSAGRVVWSCVLVALLITLFKRWPILISTLRNRRVLLGCAIGGLVISTNWTVYAYAVATDQVVQGALGYYLNPLVTVLFAVVLLRERLSRWQLAALALAGTAAVVLTIAGGQVPWIALVLGVSFATYGLTKKLGNATSLESLGLETAAMLDVLDDCVRFVRASMHCDNDAVDDDPDRDALTARDGERLDRAVEDVDLGVA